MPAYVFTGETRTTSDGTIVRRIFSPSRGLGGFIESMSNLDAGSDAWVEPDAYVYGSAVVTGSATITGDAQIRGRAVVSGDSLISTGIIEGDACLGATGAGRHRVYYKTRHYGCRPWTGLPL